MAQRIQGVIDEFRRQPAIGVAELSILIVGLVWALI